MSTIKSSNEHLTLNADGSGKDIKFQSNGAEKASLSNSGVFTAVNLIGTSTSSVPSLEAKSDGTTDGYIQLNCTANTHGIKLKSPPHSAGASYTLTFPNDDGGANQKLTTNGSGVLTWTDDNATDATKLPLAGGTMTGNVTHSSGYLDMGSGHIYLADNAQVKFGTSEDLQIYHNASSSYIKDNGDGNLHISTNGASVILQTSQGYKMVEAIKDGAVDLYHANSKKLETTANGVTVTGGAVGTMTTDNDGSFAMSASNNFKCTPAGNFTLTFTSIVAQSGNILLVNSGGHTVAAHANTKVDANLLATVSTAGTYLLSYFSDGTNVYMTNSAIYT